MGGPRWKISQGGSRGVWALSMGKERCGLGLRLLGLRCSSDLGRLYRRSASAVAVELAWVAAGWRFVRNFPGRCAQAIFVGVAEPTDLHWMK